MNTRHPRDVDPSITGQPHQVTGKVPDLMGNTSRTLGNPVDMPAAVRIPYRRNPFPGPVGPLRALPAPLPDFLPDPYAAPR